MELRPVGPSPARHFLEDFRGSRIPQRLHLRCDALAVRRYPCIAIIANSNRVKANLTTSYLVGGAANERAAHLKETQRPVHLTRDADAHSCANVRSLSNRSPKPKRTIGTQINSVQAPVDFQCSRKPSRTSRQIREFVGFAEPFH